MVLLMLFRGLSSQRLSVIENNGFFFPSQNKNDENIEAVEKNKVILQSSIYFYSWVNILHLERG